MLGAVLHPEFAFQRRTSTNFYVWYRYYTPGNAVGQQAFMRLRDSR